MAALHVVIFAAIAIITPSRIGRWFNDFAVWIRSLGAWGVVVCGLLVGMSTNFQPSYAVNSIIELELTLPVLSSHPPLFGFSASMSLIGFAYGVWPGFLIASIGSLLGGAFAFLSVRVSEDFAPFQNHPHFIVIVLLVVVTASEVANSHCPISVVCGMGDAWGGLGVTHLLTLQTFFPGIIRSHPSWDAFGRVMRDKGTILVIMISYCPMPWAIGNGLFAVSLSAT